MCGNFISKENCFKIKKRTFIFIAETPELGMQVTWQSF